VKKLKRLPLVAPSDALSGIAPVAFERAALGAKARDARHRGLVRIAAAIARDALTTCVPPGATPPALEALVAAERWSNDTDRDPSAIEQARKRAFTSLGAIEHATARALEQALERLVKKQATPIDAHADRVVIRFAALGAHYAASAVVLTLDGIQDPRELAAIPQQAAGAYAYFTVAAGAARNPELRARASEQAEWEAERWAERSGHGSESLALQYFHEFLGGHWKDLSDAARTRYFEFAAWALEGDAHF
jgi:hypothetical protein